jgi:hypothetical protein
LYQAVSHHIKCLTEQLPVIVSNIVTCKRIDSLGKLVQVNPDLVQLVIQAFLLALGFFIQ